ncbi:MAG: alpha-galactosidase [Chloroflexi bacterium]|nr:alpha-galactosidase [Chloroflexota bacterium]
MTLLHPSDFRSTPKIVNAKEARLELPSEPVRYYRHGWQSWSLAAWTDLNPPPAQKPSIYHPLQVDAEHVYDPAPNGSWLGAVELKDGGVLFLGALGLDAHVRLEGNRLCGRSEEAVEWFAAQGQEQTVFREYARELGIRFGQISKNAAPRVWCSWYSLYANIDEAVLRNAFDALGDLPFDVLQVDDGWQTDIGDWEANKKFPSGMKALADKIKSTGRRAGLWLAPLIATQSSRLFREHPDWFLRDETGRLVSAGFNWGEPLFALDTTRPNVTSWLAALMERVRVWGFDYLKLDFLYGGALKGKRYKDMPRETAYRECLKTLRAAMGADAFFLTCGTPILPALGLCDAMRIGPDVAGEWDNYRNAELFYNPSTPGTKNAIRTTIHRLWLKPLLHVDPDAAYFSMKNSLTQEQKGLLQDVARICEFKATSDLPQWMTKAEMEELRSFLHTASKAEQTGRYTFRLDGRAVDFTPAVSLPKKKSGALAVWAEVLAWLANRPFILKAYKALDDKNIKKRTVELRRD